LETFEATAEHQLRVAAATSPVPKSRHLPARIHLCLLAAVIISLAACKERAEFVPPKEANLAVSAARAYAKSNGWSYPFLREATFQNGTWIVVLWPRHNRNNADYLLFGVSPQGQVFWHSTP
jgi:hypothetical protein